MPAIVFHARDTDYIEKLNLLGAGGGGSGMTNPMTTAGDLIVGGTAGVETRLAAGATGGHVLTSNGSGVAPSWQASTGGSGTVTNTGGNLTANAIVLGAGAVDTKVLASNFLVVPGTPSTVATSLRVSNEINSVGGLIDRGLFSEEHSDTDHSAHICGLKSRGTRASPTVVQTNDYVGAMTAQAYNGSAYQRSGFIGWIVKGVSGGNVQTKAAIGTVKTGDTTETNVAYVDETGIESIGALTSGAASGVNGALNLKGSTSGTAILTVPVAAGTPTLTLPTTTGTVLTDNSTATLINKSIAGSQVTGALTSAGVTMTTARLLGRTTASTGAVEEITVGSGLSLSAGALTNTGLANPMTTGGDIMYGGASGVVTRLANGSAGQVLTSAGGTSAPSWQAPAGVGGSGIPGGTSNPGSPSDGDLFYRTDLDLLIRYRSTGTRWVTVNEYAVPMHLLTALGPQSATATPANINMATDLSRAGVYIERVVATTQSITPNTGSAYWTVQFQSHTGSGSTTNVGSSFTTAADSPDTWISHTVTVAAAMHAGDPLIRVNLTKTASPGNLYVYATVVYRLIVT